MLFFILLMFHFCEWGGFVYASASLITQSSFHIFIVCGSSPSFFFLPTLFLVCYDFWLGCVIMSAFRFNERAAASCTTLLMYSLQAYRCVAFHRCSCAVCVCSPAQRTACCLSYFSSFFLFVSHLWFFYSVSFSPVPHSDATSRQRKSMPCCRIYRAPLLLLWK